MAKTICTSRTIARFVRTVLTMALGLALLSNPAQAQWTEQAGNGWISLSMFYQNSDQRFGGDGDKVSIVRLQDRLDAMMGMDSPMRAGSVQTLSTFLTVAFGLAPGLDVWIQPSYHRLSYKDDSGTISDSGIGDTRLYLRASPTQLAGGSFPLAIRAGMKLPASDVDVGVNDVPISDSQRDWELAAEIGHSFYPASAYMIVSAGYRWRESGQFGPAGWHDMGADFGNERFFNITLGGGGDSFGFKGQVEGWYGAAPRFGPNNPGDGAARRMLRFVPSELVGAGPGQIELGSRLPLSGRNLVAGPEFVLGYFSRFSF